MSDVEERVDANDTNTIHQTDNSFQIANERSLGVPGVGVDTEEQPSEDFDSIAQKRSLDVAGLADGEAPESEGDRTTEGPAKRIKRERDWLGPLHRERRLPGAPHVFVAREALSDILSVECESFNHGCDVRFPPENGNRLVILTERTGDLMMKFCPVQHEVYFPVWRAISIPGPAMGFNTFVSNPFADVYKGGVGFINIDASGIDPVMGGFD